MKPIRQSAAHRPAASTSGPHEHFPAKRKRVAAARKSPAAATQEAAASQSLYVRIVEFLIRRRVAISIAVFGSLVIEDLVTGIVPHDIFDRHDPKAMLGLIMVLAGLAIRTWAAGFLIKDSQLTTTGPYALVRNPLYLGSFMLAGGFCLLIDDAENCWVMPALLLMLYWPKVRREERVLAERFPQQWIQYSKQTSRFFPRRFVRPRLSGWLLSQWLKSREYRAVAAVWSAIWALRLVHFLRAT